MVLTVVDRRCTHCKALLYRVRGASIGIKIKNMKIVFNPQPMETVQTTCGKCGTIDCFIPQPVNKSALLAG